MKFISRFGVMLHFNSLILIFIAVSFVSSATDDSSEDTVVDVKQTHVYGPGLKAGFFLPVRYFFIQPVSKDGKNITRSLGEKAFEVAAYHPMENRVRAFIQVLDKQDGLYIVRLRLYMSYDGMKINVLYNGEHVANSPYELKGMVYHEKCNCPEPDIQTWYQQVQCPASYKQIKLDLAPFQQVDTEKVAAEAVTRFSNKGMHSLSRYRIIENKIYRKTYGQHVGFKMFSDAVLLSLTRKVRLPDMEFFINLGDWPLEKKKVTEEPLPIFSWCGSEDTRDIVMPTYDLTEATLEMMQRVSLDIFSVMNKASPVWEEKAEKAFWRGRDSRQERLDLVVMSREQPEIIDAAMTHMFFFPKDSEKYGELVKSISFFDFFKYKYQINIDGTVAAYRFPYLIAANSVVMKQDSHYYEHFYKDLKPMEHYVPFKRDLSDLLEKIQWVKDHDEEAKNISINAQNFVFDKLLPNQIYCYHVKVFEEFSKRLVRPPAPPDDSWELVEQPSDHDSQCDCKQTVIPVQITQTETMIPVQVTQTQTNTDKVHEDL